LVSTRRFEPPEVENGGDKARQPIGLFLDCLEQVTACRFWKHDPRFSQIGHCNLDRSERRAQVMGNGADKCGPPLVDFLEQVRAQRLVAELGSLDRKAAWLA